MALSTRRHQRPQPEHRSLSIPRRWTFGIAPVLMTCIVATTSTAQNSAHVGFDAGNEGWLLNGSSQIPDQGGNPGEYIVYPAPVETWGVTLRTTSNPAFVGDFGFKGDVRIEVDVFVNFITFFGAPVPRELLLILHDDDVSGNDTNAGVWTRLGTLDGAGMPWTTLSADITDVHGADLPAGWNGIGDMDPVTLQPSLPTGSTWASVLAGIDRVEITTFEPGFLYAFTQFWVGFDNVSIQPLDGTWSDLGSALGGVSGDPLLAASGDLTSTGISCVSLSNAAPNATIGYIVGLSAANTPFLGGTLIPAPQFVLLATSDAKGRFELPFVMPAGVPSGVDFFVQVAVQDASAVAGVALSNAVVGSTP